MFVKDRQRQIIFRHALGSRAGLQDTLSLKKFRLSDREWSSLVRHVENILTAHRTEVPHSRATIDWVDSLPRWLNAYLVKKLLAADPAFVRTTHTLEESIDLYEQHRSTLATSASTDANCMRDVQRLRQRCPSDVTRIDSGLLSDLLAELADEHDYADNTLARISKHWASFFHWLRIERAISINPCDELAKEIGTRDKDLVRTEWIDEMVRACNTDEERYWLRLLQWTGCRLREGLQLRVQDLDLARGRITITETKNDRIRINPMYPAIAQYVPSIIKGREPAELVLRSITRNTCYTWLNALQDKLGLPHWQPPYNAIRSTRANQLAADPTITAQQAGMLLGHSATVARKNYLSVEDSLLEKLRGAA